MPMPLSPAGRWVCGQAGLFAMPSGWARSRPTGQPAKVDLRDVFNAILYMNRTGIPWKYLPHDFPNHGT
ncbi:transposase, partial [Streptomyces atratus]